MKRLFFTLVFVICFLASVNVVLYKKTVIAANAIPDPRVPCIDDNPIGWENPEFNSLRPYQASPCRDVPYATMCGNTLRILLDEVEADYNEADCDGNWCPPRQSDSGPITKDVVVDLSGVELPILGNTELTANSVTGTDQIDDAQKVNEYVSWYLAGTNQKAEYGPDTFEKIVNLSGPSKKLNPAVIQELNRFKSLHNAGVKPDFVFSEADEVEDYPPGSVTETQDGYVVNEADNHNQIVVCTTKNILGINNPWVGEEIPIPCYSGNGDKAKGSVYRLMSWWEGKQSPLATLFDVIQGWTATSTWSATTPPFPWQFEKDVYYQKAYNEWRGKTCVLLFEKLSCFGSGTSPSSQFYPYIPLSNTTDRKGKEWYDHVPINAPRATFVGRPELATVINKVPRLYYPHTTEVNEAVTYLNETYLPSEGVNVKSTLPDTEDNVSECKILDVRTNSGDDLTFDNTQDKHTVDFTVTYEIDKIECRQTGIREVSIHDPENYEVIIGYETEIVWDCSSDVYATVDLTTMAPELNNIWKNTVAGSGSTFRRIFPKVEEGAPVSCIADIPGVSAANFELNEGDSDEGVRLLRVLNPGDSPATNPEIYFPHLGSVYEYFLKGIQTALRPQGFGEPLVNGQTCNTTGATCGPIPDLAAGSCKLNGASSPNPNWNIPALPPTMISIFEAAGSQFNVPPALLVAIMFGEGEFNGQTDWSEENVQAWSQGCAVMPDCSGGGGEGPFSMELPTWEQYKDAVKTVDTVREPNICNFMDQTFAMANKLGNEAAGWGGYPPPQSCMGIPFNTGNKSGSSCGDWSQSDVATAIRQHEGQCYSSPGSGAGGSSVAGCPGDNCEQYSQCFGGGGSCSSHTYYLWSVYNSYK